MSASFFCSVRWFSGMLLLYNGRSRPPPFRRHLMTPLVLLCWIYARNNDAGASAWVRVGGRGVHQRALLGAHRRYNPVAKSEDIRVLRMDD